MSRVLVVATSRKTRGGITSVIKAHETGEQWEKFHCHWVQTHRDGPAWRKIMYLLSAWIDYLIRLPFYDIVHIHVSTPRSVQRKRLFFLLAKWFHKKTVLHLHLSTEQLLFDSRELYAKIFCKANVVIVLSEQWRRWIKEALNIEKNVVVLYNPCPTVECCKSIRKQHILYAGTITSRKGYETLLRAFAKIAGNNSNWKVVFAGSGEIEQGKALANELGIEKQTIFLGWVKGDSKEKAFRDASVFCLPSYAEGFPMAVLDAWAYGLPVITTPVGGIPDIADDGKNLMLFNPGDIDVLAQKIDKMISDDELRQHIAKESLKLADTTFKCKNINSQLSDIYNSLS